MGKAHSVDLRSRVVAEVAEGVSCRQSAERFKVSASSAIRWAELKKKTGDIRPRPRGGRKSRLDAHADWLLELLAKEPDLTLEAIAARAGKERKVATTETSIRRFFKRHGITFKKKFARGRAGPTGRSAGPRALARRPTRP